MMANETLTARTHPGEKKAPAALSFLDVVWNVEVQWLACFVAIGAVVWFGYLNPLPRPPTPWKICFAHFVEEFNRVRNDPVNLEAFKKEHENQRVTWDAVIRKPIPDDTNPAYEIAATKASPSRDVVFASFPPPFKANLAAGTPVKISGVISDETNELGAILVQCKLVDDNPE